MNVSELLAALPDDDSSLGASPEWAQERLREIVADLQETASGRERVRPPIASTACPCEDRRRGRAVPIRGAAIDARRGAR